MRQKILEILKKSTDYVSGEYLGETLGVSRTSIWKAIKQLRQEGYDIQAVSNRGYYLSQNKELYNAQEIEDGLGTKWLGKQVYFYKEIDSTNACIRRLAAEGAPEGTLAVAEAQSAGRGRRGKEWTSQEGVGIWMSLLLRPDISPNQTPLLTLLTGLAVCKAIQKTTDLPVKIKWPNDILIDGKKICGILTEMDGEMTRVNYVVVGIGINVNTEYFPEELGTIATSLKIENKGVTISRKKLIQAILMELEGYYERYVKERDFAYFYKEYKSACVTIGQEVYTLGKEALEGKAIDINPQGELMVQKADGSIVTIFSGEVSIRPKKKG